MLCGIVRKFLGFDSPTLRRIELRAAAAVLVAMLAGGGDRQAGAAGAGFDDITFWTGTGSNRAVMVVTWSSPEIFNNSSVPAPITTQTMFWGYRFDGAKSGEDMFNAILAADPRLYSFVSGATQYGKAVFGLGYDLDSDGEYGLTDGFTTFGPGDFNDGLVVGSYGDPDFFTATDPDDLYWGGWYGPNWELWHELGGNGGFTTAPDRGPDPYFTSDGVYGGVHGEWYFSETGISGMTLEDGSWMGWSVAAGGLDFGDPTSEGTIAWLDHKVAPYMAPVPEPSSFALAAAGLGCLLIVDRRRRIRRRFPLLLGGLVVTIACASGSDAVLADSPYATELISQNATYGSQSLYNDPNSVLGEPTRIAVNNDPIVGTSPFHVKLVEPAYNRDLDGNKVITTLSRRIVAGSPVYGSITVKFDHQIFDDPANPYGIDLNVFGNSFYVGSNFVSDASDMRAYNLVGGIFTEPVVVSVSPDNVNWYTYSAGPYGDTAFPTHGYEWSADQHDATGNGWTTHEMDFTKPVNPTLGSVLGATGQTMRAVDAIGTYVGSGGGTGIDLAASGFAWIQYVRVEATAAFRDGEIDAFADVRPMRVGETLSITPNNVVQGTSLYFQSPEDESRTGVLAEFISVSDLAKISTSELDDAVLLAALPAGNLLAGYGLAIDALIGDGSIDYMANFGLLPGLEYAGNGSDLGLFHWDGAAWQSLTFQFDTASGLVQLSNWSEATSSLAIMQVVPEPATIVLLLTGVAGAAFCRRHVSKRQA